MIDIRSGVGHEERAAPGLDARELERGSGRYLARACGVSCGEPSNSVGVR